MKRKIYSQLQDWKKQWQGRTALLIDGARRIGKSWICEEFGKNEYKSYILIDFNNISPEIKDLIDHHLTDLDIFFSRLSIFTGIELYHRESLIIFDEVQLCPKVRAAIKYFVKDGRYDFIETGSLVSINQNVKDIVIPSEEIRLNMYPMDLEEFAWAMGRTSLFNLVKDNFASKTPLGQSLHRQMMEIVRTYMIVGGMPQAVLSYAERKDFRDVEAIKQSILALYKNDIIKYAGRSAPKVTAVYENIPGLLQQHEKKFKPSTVRRGARMKDFSEALFWLNESRVINPCYSTTEPGVGLALNKNEAKVKLYMADTGLLLSMAFEPRALEEEGIYRKILTDKLEFNKGMLTENLVAQLLQTSGHPLYFFSSYSRENADDRMEIDFLVRKRETTSRHNIYAIEVKSGSRYALSSLEKFSRKYRNYLGRSIVIHSKDLQIKEGILYLPLYMAGLI